MSQFKNKVFKYDRYELQRFQLGGQYIIVSITLH